MADLTGNNPGAEKGAFKDRKFINIDRENFDDVMENKTPFIIDSSRHLNW